MIVNIYYYLCKCILSDIYPTFFLSIIYIFLIFFIDYNYTVQHHEQLSCWNGAIEEIHIIIIIKLSVAVAP